MIVVYVAGPFRAKSMSRRGMNIQRARELAFQVAEAGAMPLCPHTNSGSFDGTLTEEFWLEGCLELLRRCDALITVPGWEQSEGTRVEVTQANLWNIPVFYTVPELGAWLASGNATHLKRG